MMATRPSMSNFYSRTSSGASRRTPLAPSNSRFRETGRFLRQQDSVLASYSPGERLQDKSGVDFDEESWEEENEENYGRRGQDYDSPYLSPQGSIPHLADAGFATPSRFDLGPSLPPPRRHDRGQSSDISLRAVLQEQHALLERILASQEALEDKHAQFEAKLAAIEQKCSTPSSSPSTEDTGHKRKRVVTRELSVSCRVLVYLPIAITSFYDVSVYYTCAHGVATILNTMASYAGSIKTCPASLVSIYIAYLHV